MSDKELLNEQEDMAQAMAEADTSVAEDEEDIKIYNPKSKEKSTESVDDQNTRILDFDTHKQRRHKKDLPEQPDMEGQLRFEGMETDELPKEQPSKTIEEQLQDARREKVENFRLIENEKMGFRLSGEEDQESLPMEEEQPDENGVLEDYNSYAETAAVRGELTYRRRAGRISLLIGGFLEFLLICLLLLTKSGGGTTEPIVLLGANLLLLVGLMLVAHRVIADGFFGVIRLRFSADTVTAIAAFTAVIHTVLQFLSLGEVATLYTAVAGFSLFLGLCGRQYRISRICGNFKLVSHKGDKYAAMFATETKHCEQLGRYVVTVGEPAIAYLKKSQFLSKFMENSYDEEGHESLFRWFSPAVVGLSLVLAVVHLFVGGETATFWSAIGVLAASLCAASPAFAVAGANLPFCRVGKFLLKRGAMLIGWKAVQQFKNTDALVVDASEVFPGETVLLHGIKTFSGARIDEAILDAAAVSIEAGGPLAGVFRRVIENRMDMLQEVDTLLYEQEMGLSGWVGGRRVLVGNRRLLENHGVDVPSRDYEMRYTKDNRQLVYLSTGGELCAMFVVSYTADKDIGEALRRLTESGITLLIRTCDANVTQDLVHNVFHIDEDAVRVLDTAAGRVRDTLVLEEAERAEAVLACNGRLEGLGTALSLCRRVYKRVLSTGVLQMIAAGLGLLIVVLSVLMQHTPSPMLLIVHMLVWAFITAGWTGFLVKK